MRWNSFDYSAVIVSSLMLLMPFSAQAAIEPDPSIDNTDITTSQITVDNITYDILSVAGYCQTPEVAESGEPQIPNKVLNYILPPGMEIGGIEITSMEWDTLSGTFYLYPVQNESMEDTVFVLPDGEIYQSEEPWPALPVEVVSQSGMMGAGVASIRLTPLRYIPSDSLLLSLERIVISIDYVAANSFEVIVPVSETAWSYENRVHGILASVENPGDYETAQVDSDRRQTDDQFGPLTVTDIPSPNGDGVDFVIITTSDLTDEWQELADIRIRQGIVTVVKSVSWIESEYEGCDTQEKIKNFITDAYEFWGTGVVLLGGDHELVPSRMCHENHSGQDYSYPCDGYYSDVDDIDAWENSGGYWKQPALDTKMDVSVGRVPVNSASQVEGFLNKLSLYENPSSLPSGYSRSALFVGDSHASSGGGNGARQLEALNQEMIAAGIAGPGGTCLNPITELYWPQSGSSWSGDLLTRNSFIDAIEDGAHIIFHASHSGTHLLGAQAALGLGVRQFLTEGDIQALSNTNKPSILLSIGCWPGHFQGAECILERGLLSSDDTGLIAAMGFAKTGYWPNTEFYCSEFANALYEYKPYSGDSVSYVRVGPYRYLGDSYRHMLNNIKQGTEKYMNLLGDPSMFVWRGNASRPTVTVSPSTVTAGTFSTTVHVAEMGIALSGARVCLYKEDELFAIETTDSNGNATFTDIQVATPGTITATVTKRRAAISIVNYLPATTSITVNQSTGALVCLDELTVDDDDLSGTCGNNDGEINPGETVRFDLAVNNQGQSPATNATATLNIVSGSEQIEAQIDMTESLGTVATGTTVYPGAFSLEISDDVNANADPVILQVAFSYDQGSRNDPADFRVLAGDLDLPIRTMTITQGDPLVIDIDNMFVTNSGLGNLEDVEVEFTNPSGGVTFAGTLSHNFGDLSNGSGEEVEDGIRAILKNPSGCWNPVNSSATFDLVVSHRWGGTKTITVNALDVINQGTVQPPSSSSLSVLSATHESIGFEWGSSSSTEEGWYLWKKADGVFGWTRVTAFALDDLLRHGTVGDLSSGTRYDVGVSTLGQYGQESSVVSISTSTTCDEVTGWPVYLDGSTGSGPAITDIDGDGNNEVIAATTAGSVYIIDRDGTRSKIYDSACLFSGVAIGDVIPGGRDEIVVSGWDYDVAAGKKAVVVVLSWVQYIGWTGTEIDADQGSDQRIHENLTVPVIFDADGSGNLEIALRTFNGTYSGSPYSWLYVWEYSNNQWSAINNSFPLSLTSGEWEYAPPVYIGDTDSDGNTELVVSNGAGHLLWIEPETGQTSDWDVSSAFPSGYNWNLGQSYLVAVKEGTITKLISVGRDQISLTKGNYATVCLNAGNSGSSIWSTAVNSTQDCFGNFGGPAIGDVDGNNSLDLVNQWILPNNNHSGIIEYLAISNGSRSTLSDVPHNEHYEDFAMSPMILAGAEGTGLGAFGSSSTLSHGSRYRSGSPEFIPGSSYWSEDRCPSTPAAGNLDSDSELEVIFADDSGVLHALDMNLAASSNDWPTLQHDLQRTGYFNFSAENSLDTSFDVAVISAERVPVVSPEGRNAVLSISVSISGSADTEKYENHAEPAAALVREPESVSCAAGHTAMVIPASESAVPIPEQETVLIAAFCGRELAAETSIPVSEGIREVTLSVPGEITEVTIVADPFGNYSECDESNNSLSLEDTQTVDFENFEITASKTGVLVSVPGRAVSGSVLNARLYSIDGRCISSETIETAAGEGFSLHLADSGASLPSGCYVILMDDGSETLLRRKVLVIEQ